MLYIDFYYRNQSLNHRPFDSTSIYIDDETFGYRTMKNLERTVLHFALELLHRIL